MVVLEVVVVIVKKIIKNYSEMRTKIDLRITMNSVSSIKLKTESINSKISSKIWEYEEIFFSFSRIFIIIGIFI